jgi:hypothetical protein
MGLGVLIVGAIASAKMVYETAARPLSYVGADQDSPNPNEISLRLLAGTVDIVLKTLAQQPKR